MNVINIELDGSDDAIDRAFELIIKASTAGTPLDIRVYGDSLEQIEVLTDLINQLGSQPTVD